MRSAPAKDIDEYIARFPAPIQERLQQVRAIVKKAAPLAKEAIKYDMPTFVQNGNLVHFAAFKKHIGFFGTPAANPEFKPLMAPYKQGKGSIQFPFDQPLPLSLIDKIVKHRVQKDGEKEGRRK